MMNLRSLRSGLRVVEVPSFEAEQRHGRSQLRALPDGWRVLRTILREATPGRKRLARHGGVERQDTAFPRPAA